MGDSGRRVSGLHSQCVILGEILLGTLDRIREGLITDEELEQYHDASVDTGRRQVVEYLITLYYKHRVAKSVVVKDEPDDQTPFHGKSPAGKKRSRSKTAKNDQDEPFPKTKKSAQAQEIVVLETVTSAGDFDEVENEAGDDAESDNEADDTDIFTASYQDNDSYNENADILKQDVNIESESDNDDVGDIGGFVDRTDEDPDYNPLTAKSTRTKASISPARKSPLKSSSIKSSSVALGRVLVKQEMGSAAEEQGQATDQNTVGTPEEEGTPMMTSPLQLANIGTTLKGVPRKRLHSYPFTTEEKIDLLHWFAENKLLGICSTDYTYCKRQAFIDAKAATYSTDGVLCSGQQLFNFMKTQRRHYTNWTKYNEVGRAVASDMSKLDEVKKVAYTIFKREGKEILRRARIIKTHTSFGSHLSTSSAEGDLSSAENTAGRGIVPLPHISPHPSPTPPAHDEKATEAHVKAIISKFILEKDTSNLTPYQRRVKSFCDFSYHVMIQIPEASFQDFTMECQNLISRWAST